MSVVEKRDGHLSTVFLRNYSVVESRTLLAIMLYYLSSIQMLLIQQFFWLDCGFLGVFGWLVFDLCCFVHLFLLGGLIFHFIMYLLTKTSQHCLIFCYFMMLEYLPHLFQWDDTSLWLFFFSMEERMRDFLTATELAPRQRC